MLKSNYVHLNLHRRSTMESLGYKLKTLRMENKYTQEELAQKLFVTRQTISKWENEKTIPDIKTLNQICSFYNIQLVSLVSENISDQKETNHHITYIKYLALSVNSVIVFIFLFNLVQRSFFVYTHGAFTWFILVLLGVILLSNIVILLISDSYKIYIFTIVLPVLILIIVHAIV